MTPPRIVTCLPPSTRIAVPAYLSGSPNGSPPSSVTPVRSTVMPSPRIVRTGPSFSAGRRYLPARNFVDFVMTSPAVGAGSCEGGGVGACHAPAASAIPAHARGARILDAIQLRFPLEAELSRRRHVADECRRRHDRGTCEIAFAADAHAVLPVPIE